MHSPVFALKRAYQATPNVLESELKNHGVTVPQLEVLKLFFRPVGESTDLV